MHFWCRASRSVILDFTPLRQTRMTHVCFEHSCLMFAKWFGACMRELQFCSIYWSLNLKESWKFFTWICWKINDDIFEKFWNWIKKWKRTPQKWTIRRCIWMIKWPKQSHWWKGRNAASADTLKICLAPQLSARIFNCVYVQVVKPILSQCLVQPNSGIRNKLRPFKNISVCNCADVIARHTARITANCSNNRTIVISRSRAMHRNWDHFATDKICKYSPHKQWSGEKMDCFLLCQWKNFHMASKTHLQRYRLFC